MKRSSSDRDSASFALGDRPLLAQRDEPLEPAPRLGRVEREARRVVGAVDDLAAGRPDERRRAHDPRLDADARRCPPPFSCSRRARRSRRRSSPSRARSTPGLLERVGVVVDDERRDVLRDALQLAVDGERRRPAAGRTSLGVERRRRLDHAAPRVAAEVAVVDEEDVGRVAAGERGQQLGEVRLAVGDLDELHLAAGLVAGSRATSSR